MNAAQEAPRVKICGYCQERVRQPVAEKHAVTFGLDGDRRTVRIWFCSNHCIFWGAAKHAREGFATTIKSLRGIFGAGVEVMK